MHYPKQENNLLPAIKITTMVICMYVRTFLGVSCKFLTSKTKTEKKNRDYNYLKHVWGFFFVCLPFYELIINARPRPSYSYRLVI